MGPGHFDSLPEDHEFNKLFHWYLEEGGETGVVHDVSKAKKLANAANVNSGDEKFEVVEITDGNKASSIGGEFLGFDLSQGFCNSLLWEGLKVERAQEDKPSIQTLCQLLEEFFRPRLNQYGLFSDFQTASFCLKAKVALQSFHDSLFEGRDLNVFKVVSVYRISD